MRVVDNVNSRLNHTGVPMHPVKVCTYQLSIPGPVIFSISGRMHASISSTLPDVLLEGSLLARIQNLTGCQQKYDGIIAREIGSGKNRGVFGKIEGHIL